MMPLLVRRMRGEDSAAWAALRRKLWSDTALEAHLADIARMLGQERHRAYLALGPDGAPLGFAELSLRDYANGCTAQPVPFLEGIWVEPGHRRQGIGRRLLEKMTQELKEQGFRELCSDAGIRNKASHRAHENWGFHETERVVYFRKPLG